MVSVIHTICLKGYSPYLKTIFNVYIPTLNMANPVVSNNVLELRTSPQLSLEFEVMKRTTLWLKSTWAVLTYVRISCSKGVFQKSAAYYLFSRCVINKNVFNISWYTFNIYATNLLYLISITTFLMCFCYQIGKKAELTKNILYINTKYTLATVSLSICIYYFIHMYVYFKCMYLLVI